jgi:hypothetical protein
LRIAIPRAFHEHCITTRFRRREHFLSSLREPLPASDLKRWVVSTFIVERLPMPNITDIKDA